MKILLSAVAALVCVQAQSFQDLLLPQAVHITGVVVDTEGKPVVDARIDHMGDAQQEYQTDSDGRFELNTRAPALVIRKSGFQSELVRTQGNAEPRVTLPKDPEDRQFPTCSDTGQYDGIDGWGSLFLFPRTPGVKVSPQGQDADYAARNYYIESTQGTKGIVHGVGLQWDDGMPSDQDVWRSVGYDEITYGAGPFPITDARGQTPDGNVGVTLASLASRLFIQM